MKTFKEFKANLEERCWTGYKPVPGKKAYSKGSCVKEDGGAGGSAGGVASAGPTNVVGGGAIAGTGGKGGEPGVYLKKKKAHNPVMMGMGHRKPPKI